MPAALGILNNLSNFTGLGYLGSGVKSLGDKEYKQAASQFAKGTLRLALTAAVSALSIGMIFGYGRRLFRGDWPEDPPPRRRFRRDLPKETACLACFPEGSYEYASDWAVCGPKSRANAFFYKANLLTVEDICKKRGKGIEQLYAKDFPHESFNFITNSPTRAADSIRAHCDANTNSFQCSELKCRQDTRANCLSDVLSNRDLMRELFSIETSAQPQDFKKFNLIQCRSIF